MCVKVLRRVRVCVYNKMLRYTLREIICSLLSLVRNDDNPVYNNNEDAKSSFQSHETTELVCIVSLCN